MRSFADEIEGEEAVYALPSWCDAATKVQTHFHSAHPLP